MFAVSHTAACPFRFIEEIKKNAVSTFFDFKQVRTRYVRVPVWVYYIPVYQYKDIYHRYRTSCKKASGSKQVKLSNHIKLQL